MSKGFHNCTQVHNKTNKAFATFTQDTKVQRAAQLALMTCEGHPIQLTASACIAWPHLIAWNIDQHHKFVPHSPLPGHY
jgi:hypothetical protein